MIRFLIFPALMPFLSLLMFGVGVSACQNTALSIGAGDMRAPLLIAYLLSVVPSCICAGIDWAMSKVMTFRARVVSMIFVGAAICAVWNLFLLSLLHVSPISSFGYWACVVALAGAVPAAVCSVLSGEGGNRVASSDVVVDHGDTSPTPR